MHRFKTDIFSGSLREKFRFTRQVIPALLTWLLISLAVSAIGWGTFFSIENTAKKNAEARALRDTASFAQSQADRLKRTVDSIDQMMRHVQLEWELSGGKLQLESLKKYGLFPSPDANYIIIFNRDGIPILTTLSNLPTISAADRPYFLAQKSASADTLYISPPFLGRASGIHVIQFSRRLTDANGAFDGVVVVSTAATLFTANYNTSVLGAGGLLGFVSKDQTVMVTRIGNTVSSPGTPKLFSNPPFTTSGGSAFFDGKLFGDMRSRYVGWEQVQGYSLTAFAGLDGEEALTNYQSQYDTSLRNVTLATLGLALLTLAAMVLTVEMDWRKHQLFLTYATYRLATEEGSEGIYIYQPISDPTGFITDFRLTDCNHRAAEFFKARRDALINKTVSSFRHGIDVQNLMHLLTEAWDKGNYEGEVETPAGSSLQLRWAEIKILRSNQLLAVRVRDISEAKEHITELKRRSDEDVLTRLPNRHWIQNYLPKAIGQAKEADTSLALLFIDLDGFKKVNDTAGHAAGDEVLQHAAERLQEAIRPQDKVVRFGGDEFVVILENIEHRIDAAHVAERVQHVFEQPFRLSQGVHAVGTSIGIALFPTDGQDASALLEKADIAMYSVKTNGKRGYQFYEAKFYNALRERLNQESEIRRAVERDEFVMYYQPRVDVTTGTIVSLEALIRWQHPSRGLLEPADFIQLAEETGLIIQIGELVINKVCAQLARWSRQQTEIVPVSVNVSPRQINNADVVDILSAALARHAVPAHLIELEITESSMVAEGSEILKKLSILQGEGIKILVDDFGTGYSSLSQLHRLNFDVLKVDQTFTSEIENSAEARVFFTAIVTMAHALHMRVVAEGVETQGQITILRELQCDEIQGFYISRPLPPGDSQPVLSKLAFPRADEW
jgi:diguanylate cyclase (GGDEF)-like protein